MRTPTLLSCLLSLSLAPAVACAPAGTDEDAEVSEDELRALTSAEIVGTLADGETKTVEVVGKPLYRAFRLEVGAGEKLDLWVRSPSGDGDPQAWLLGSSFQTIARSTDVSAQDASAHFERTIAKAGTYYLAIRDEKSRTVTFSVSRGQAAPRPAAQCTTDAQCGGGSAMCFIDRCRTVSESSFVVDTLSGGSVAAAYAPSGELRVAYNAYRSGTHTLFSGPFGAATGGGGSSSSTPFVLDHGPGLEPVVAHSYYHYNGGGVGYGPWGGPSLGYHESVKGFAVGRNAAGTLFAAVVRNTPAPVNSYQSDRCTLWFASRPSGGAWTSLEQVDTCGSGGYRNLAIHVRKDGGADIVAAPEFGDVIRYHRNNPIDPWGKVSLSSPNDTQGRAAFVFTHGVDGTTHLVSQNYVFTTDLSRGDYTGIYIELGDDGPVRTIPLSTHREQYRYPFPDLDLDGEGNVWIQKRPTDTNDRSSVVRIDKAGNVAERSIGLMATGSWRYSSLAVSPQGEIAIVHVGDSRNVFLRRFTPVN